MSWAVSLLPVQFCRSPSPANQDWDDEFARQLTSPSVGEVVAKPQVRVIAKATLTPTLRVNPPHKGEVRALTDRR